MKDVILNKRKLQMLANTSLVITPKEARKLLGRDSTDMPEDLLMILIAQLQELALEMLKLKEIKNSDICNQNIYNKKEL